MGKIKSSREIALERTAHLKEQAAGDLSAFDRAQYLKAAGLLARSCLEGDKEPDQVAEAVGRYPQKVREEAEKTLLRSASAAMSFDNCPQVRALVELLRQDSAGRKIAASLEELHRRYQDNLEKNRALLSRDGARAALLELHQAGISGSAIAGVNLERTSWWKQAAVNTARQLETELEQLKKNLLTALEI